MKSALRELPGCETPKAPTAAKRPRPLSRAEYVDGILRGDRTVLARAVTLIESARETDRELAEQIVEDCLPHCSDSIRVGITGVPGAGKSTLIEALGGYPDRGTKGESRSTGDRSEQPNLWRKHSGGQDAHANAGRERDGVYQAVAFARHGRRRGAADTRGDAAV